jgi:hypothetical protein
VKTSLICELAPELLYCWQKAGIILRKIGSSSMEVLIPTSGSLGFGYILFTCLVFSISIITQSIDAFSMRCQVCRMSMPFVGTNFVIPSNPSSFLDIRTHRGRVRAVGTSPPSNFNPPTNPYAMASNPSSDSFQHNNLLIQTMSQHYSF